MKPDERTLAGLRRLLNDAAAEEACTALGDHEIAVLVEDELYSHPPRGTARVIFAEAAKRLQRSGLHAMLDDAGVPPNEDVAVRVQALAAMAKQAREELERIRGKLDRMRV